MSKPTYPLLDHQAESLRTAGGRRLSEVTLEQAAAGELSAADLEVSPETLYAQAELARRAGYEQLARNLTRAAELTAVPNEELLGMYELLRPRRATFEELNALADRLAETYHAPETARFVRQAAGVYRERNLLRIKD